MKKYLAVIWERGSAAASVEDKVGVRGPAGRRTYVGDQHNRGEQARQREAVANLLHQDTGGAQRGRRNERAAVVVHDDADGDVQRSHDELAKREGLEVLLVVLHLGDNVEVRGGTSIGKDDTGERCCCFSERRVL